MIIFTHIHVHLMHFNHFHGRIKSDGRAGCSEISGNIFKVESAKNLNEYISNWLMIGF